MLAALQVVGTAGIVVLVVTHSPDNHLGLDIRVGYIPPILTILLALASPLHSQSLVKAVIAGSLLFLLLLVVVDFGNILVEYEEWCSRGMPPSILMEWLNPESSDKTQPHFLLRNSPQRAIVPILFPGS